MKALTTISTCSPVMELFYLLTNLPAYLVRRELLLIIIITNDTSNIIYPCVFLSDISDHFPVVCLVAHNSSFKKGRSHINKVLIRVETRVVLILNN